MDCPKNVKLETLDSALHNCLSEAQLGSNCVRSWRAERASTSTANTYLPF